ncbi:hypothetical protein ONZ45_g11713 [Pleurotus djamor]|nr:hypothetical protein ONZ45_g11713 [Pleurotus djamor]
MATATDFAAQELVDEEIAAELKRHQEHIKVLNIRRNSFCAVNRLPSDVLACILLYVKLQAEASNSRMDTSYSPSYSQCMVLLRVCHTWHDHVMNDARFWCTINLNLPAAQVSKMLARSKAALLQIQLCVPTPSANEEVFWSLVSDVLSEPHTLRLQELSVMAFNSYHLSQALAYIPTTSRVPRLERLSIHVKMYWQAVSKLFWSDLPSLRSLTIFGGPLPSTTPSMQHLTLLTIGPQPSNHHVTIPWLLAALSSLPDIRDVTIQDLHGPNVEPDFPPVSLPRLQSLSLGSLDPSTLSILNHVVTPSSSMVQLLYGSVRPHDMKRADFSSLNSAISRMLAAVTSIDEVIVSILTSFVNYARQSLSIKYPPSRSTS